MPAALADTSQIICEVWASNVEEEMRKIRQIIQSYNYIAMVTLNFNKLKSLGCFAVFWREMLFYQ